MAGPLGPRQRRPRRARRPGRPRACRPEMARVPPLAESDWPEELRSVLEARPAALDTRLGDNNIFATFARHKDLFRAWLPFGGFLLAGGVLPARERELLILRTG